MRPDGLFHRTTAEAWAGAQSAGEVAPASLADEGFVHCSTGDQLTGTIERHFPGATDLVVLRLRRDLLDPELRWEESGHGTYPHLYRPITPAAVAEATPWPPTHPPSPPPTSRPLPLFTPRSARRSRQSPATHRPSPTQSTSHATRPVPTPPTSTNQGRR